MTNKLNNFYILSIFCLVIFFQIFLVNAQQVINYTNSKPGTSTTSNLVVQVLKYDPYPVSAGDWFSVWIKVQNIGQDDAKDVRFKLIAEYPFSSSDTLVRDYSTILGTVHGYASGYPDDASQVILKYRVKVEDSAPVGTSNLKLMMQTNKNDPSASSISNILPIEIGKTKTDFDVVMQDSTTQGTSFAISNIGDSDATAVTISIAPQDYMNISGVKSSIIGNLAKGDFTTLSFQISPNRNLKEVKIKIDYTDISGVRNSVEKIVPVSISSNFGQQITTRSNASSNTKYYYLIGGIILGILIVFIYRKIRKKK